MKIKIKASMRTKKRYLLLNAESEEVVKGAILDYLGILGWARANPLFVRKSKGKIVLAVNREKIEDVKAAFALSSERIEVARVSGTLKGLAK